MDTINTYGLKKEQVHRILEDIETLALSARLIVQIAENLGRDVQGMLNGNNNEKKSSCA